MSTVFCKKERALKHIRFNAHESFLTFSPNQAYSLVIKSATTPHTVSLSPDRQGNNALESFPNDGWPESRLPANYGFPLSPLPGSKVAPPASPFPAIRTIFLPIILFRFPPASRSEQIIWSMFGQGCLPLPNPDEPYNRGRLRALSISLHEACTAGFLFEYS